MPRGTTLRNVRIDDELWQAAQQRADVEGFTKDNGGVSVVIRLLLEAWVQGEIAVTL